ncbi:hypothetical protein CR513_35413, partial [Mucuna pruriens]
MEEEAPSYSTTTKEIESDHLICRKERGDQTTCNRLVQVVPKKSEMTVTKNQHDEMVPTRIQNSW